LFGKKPKECKRHDANGLRPFCGKCEKPILGTAADNKALIKLTKDQNRAGQAGAGAEAQVPKLKRYSSPRPDWKKGNRRLIERFARESIRCEQS